MHVARVGSFLWRKPQASGHRCWWLQVEPVNSEMAWVGGTWVGTPTVCFSYHAKASATGKRHRSETEAHNQSPAIQTGVQVRARLVAKPS